MSQSQSQLLIPHPYSHFCPSVSPVKPRPFLFPSPSSPFVSPSASVSVSPIPRSASSLSTRRPRSPETMRSMTTTTTTASATTSGRTSPRSTQSQSPHTHDRDDHEHDDDEYYDNLPSFIPSMTDDEDARSEHRARMMRLQRYRPQATKTFRRLATLFRRRTDDLEWSSGPYSP
ncbi:hypothetical protein SISNIDRAFT_450629, partial [Sistotremastrum niveocremeum HHB9708]